MTKLEIVQEYLIELRNNEDAYMADVFKAVLDILISRLENEIDEYNASRN